MVIPLEPTPPPNNYRWMVHVLVHALFQGLLYMLGVAVLMFAIGAFVGLLVPEKDCYPNRFFNSLTIGSCFVLWGFYCWVLPVFVLVGMARTLSKGSHN